MARIGNAEKYVRKFKEDFTLVKRKLLRESYRLSQTDRNELIDCLTQLENLLQDEIEEILKNP
jgi:hypothetical protein